MSRYFTVHQPAEDSVRKTGSGVRNCFRNQDTSDLPELCYLAFLGILSALKALGFYEGQTIFTIFLVIACLFLLGKIVLTEHSVPEYVVILAMLGMGALVYLNTGEKSLLVNLMVLIGIKGVSGRRAMRVFLVVWGVGFTLLTFVSLIGLNEETILLHNKTGLGYVICHTLGYSHSNVLHMNYLCICAMVLFLAKDRLNRRQQLAFLMILLAGDIYVFIYSISYTGMLGTLALFFLYAYVTFRGKCSRIEKVLAELILPACILFMLVGPFVFKGQVYNKINDLLSTRYDLTKYFLTQQPITLFGTRFELSDYRYTLDCSYAYLFMQLGVIPFVILILLYMGTIHYMVKENRLQELAIMLGLCIAGTTEPFLFNLGFKNVSLIFVGEYLYDLIGRVQRRFGWGQQTFCLATLIPLDGKKTGKITPLPANGQDPSDDAERRLEKQEYRKGEMSLLMSVVTAVTDILRLAAGLCDRVCGIGKRILIVWMENWKRYLLLAAAVLILICGAARLMSTPIETVYVNSSVNAESDADRMHVYLTEEQAAEVRESGNLIFGYIDEEEAMYPYAGNTARIEYWRDILSLGVWSAVIVCLSAGVKAQYRETTDRNSSRKAF